LQLSERTSLHPTLLVLPVTFDPTPGPTDSERGDVGVVGTARISENDEEPIISNIEEARGSGSEGMTSSASKATSVLATLFTLTMIGGVVYYLSKKYPKKFSTLDGHLRGTLERMGTIVRIVRGDDLVDIVSDASASTNSKKKAAPPSRHEGEMQNATAGENVADGQNLGLAKKNSFGSTKSAVRFAKDLVTVIPIPTPVPMQRNVSFVDSKGGELATELGPTAARFQSNSLDEIDDYLGSSSRSTTSGEGDITDSSGTFDSTDEAMEHYDSWANRSGRVAFRAHLGNTQIEIPSFPGFGISSPSPRNQGEFWADDAV